jgi:hypothetical protein
VWLEHFYKPKISEIVDHFVTMGRGKAPSQKKPKHERGPPAESTDDVSASLSSLSISSGGKFPIPLAMWVHPCNLSTNMLDFNHCDPKRCSGKKLERAGVIKSLRIGQKCRGVVITFVSISRSTNKQSKWQNPRVACRQ